MTFKIQYGNCVVCGKLLNQHTGAEYCSSDCYNADEEDSE